MRDTDHNQSGMFSYISAELRVLRDHPLRPLRVMVDAALKASGPAALRLFTSRLDGYRLRRRSCCGALLVQVLDSVRSERLLMEQRDYNFLFR
jgi:hypothetical protein